MTSTVEPATFQKQTADYFNEKAKAAKGPDKLLVGLEMSQYLTAARQHGLSFEELEKAGFRFATVPDIKI